MEKLNSTISTYLEAMEKFSEAAKTFLQHVHILYQARDEYRKALAAGSELRQALDTGDETLRTLMAKLERAVNAPLDEAVSDKRGLGIGAEPGKVETMKVSASAAGGGVARIFP